jgi:hypothetical protein
MKRHFVDEPLPEPFGNLPVTPGSFDQSVIGEHCRGLRRGPSLLRTTKIQIIAGGLFVSGELGVRGRQRNAVGGFGRNSRRVNRFHGELSVFLSGCGVTL